MKRLTDERVLQIQEDEGAGRVGNPDYATGDELDSLFRDHLQVREDVKRLAKDLREWMISIHPSDCGCGPCAKTRALLSEVGQ